MTEKIYRGFVRVVIQELAVEDNKSKVKDEKVLSAFVVNGKCKKDVLFRLLTELDATEELDE